MNDRYVAVVRPHLLNGSSTTVHCHWLAAPKADRQLFCLDFSVSRDNHWASNPCASNLRVRPFSVCVQPSHLDYGPRGGKELVHLVSAGQDDKREGGHAAVQHDDEGAGGGAVRRVCRVGRQDRHGKRY